MLRRARSVKGSHIDIARGFLLNLSYLISNSNYRCGVSFPQDFASLVAYLVGMPTVEQVREALVEVKDPELNLGILELGLVYDITTEGENGENVSVMMTLTSPMCPVGPMFMQSVKDRVLAIDGVKDANVEITFTPPWDPHTMASDDVKALLGIW
jgi:metal-sulfur cluster biosynthetic enzyme